MKPKRMMDIDSEQVKEMIRKKMYLTEMAVLLKPHMMTREDAYHGFKYWLKVGRMPRDRYEYMMEILNDYHG